MIQIVVENKQIEIKDLNDRLVIDLYKNRIVWKAKVIKIFVSNA